MRIVIATDLSEASLAAVDLVAACPSDSLEHVALVHAIDVDLYTAGGTVPALIELAEERLGEIARDLTDAGIEAELHVEVGPAAEVIDRIAAEERADLVVMTNLGRGALTGRLLGSTAEVLASKSRRPVLIARVGEREGGWCRLGEGAPFERMLVGADLTESLARQLGAVSGLPGVAEVRVVHVADPGLDPEIVHEQLALLCAGSALGVPCEPIVRSGKDPSEALLAEAAEWGATTIAVSPASHGVVHRALWGSTARTIAKQSPVPVLFVPVVAADV